MNGNVACMWEKRNVYRVSMGKPKGMRPTVRHKYGSEDNI
jgi:hypothetical protein